VGSTASRALGHRGLGEDDGTAGPGMARVDGVVGLGMAHGAPCCRFGEEDLVAGSGMTSRAWGRCLRGRWHHRLGLGKMAVLKGDRPWSGMIARRLRGELNDGTGSRVVDDDAGSREIFGGKFWQPDGVSESLHGLGFEKVVQWFVYWETIVATNISDVIRAIAAENHSSNRRLPSSACC
jgi:hypothetical protein